MRFELCFGFKFILDNVFSIALASNIQSFLSFFQHFDLILRFTFVNIVLIRLFFREWWESRVGTCAIKYFKRSFANFKSTYYKSMTNRFKKALHEFIQDIWPKQIFLSNLNVTLITFLHQFGLKMKIWAKTVQIKEFELVVFMLNYVNLGGKSILMASWCIWPNFNVFSFTFV